MAATQLIAASASAVVAPALLGGLVSQLPGGPIATAGVGVALIWGGTKMDGIAKGVVVGAGAGFVTVAVLSFVGPSMTVSA